MSYIINKYHSPVLHVIKCSTCHDVRDRHDWIVINQATDSSRIAFCSESCVNMFLLSGEKILDWKYRTPESPLDDGLELRLGE